MAIDEVQRNLLVSLASFVGFGASYAVAWALSARFSSSFRKLAPPEKADWASRVGHSNLHAVLICALVYACVATIDFNGPGHSPTTDTTLAQVTFSISIGYFAFDLCICLWWLLPMWSIFLLHHIVALIPYAISNFYQTCDYGMYELVLFLLVETSTIPLNAVNLYELAGRKGSKGHTVSFFCLFASWLLFRVVLPIYLLVCVWVYAFPHVGAEAWCLVPAMVCAHAIVFFCLYVFVSVLVPDFLGRMRGTSSKVEAAPKEPLSLADGEAKTAELADLAELGLEFPTGSNSSGHGNGKGRGGGGAAEPGSPDTPYHAMKSEGRAEKCGGASVSHLHIEAGEDEVQFENFGGLISAGPRALAHAFGREMHIPHEEGVSVSPIRTPRSTPAFSGEDHPGSPGQLARTPSGYMR